MTRRLSTWLPYALALCLAAFASNAIAAGEAKAPQDTNWGRKTLDFINLVVDGSYEVACFNLNASSKILIPPQRLKKVWLGAQEHYGKFEDLGLPVPMIIKGYHVVDVPTRFEWRTINFRVAWDSTGAVSRFDLMPTDEDKEGTPNGVPARDEEIMLGNDSLKAGGGALRSGATLSLPPMHGKRVPVVILVSGRERRGLGDVTGTFLSRGIAVLRWERPFDADRWVSESAPAVQFLRNRIEVDSRRIFLVGETSTPLKTESKSHDLAGVTTYADVRLSADDVNKLATWILGGTPSGN